MAVRFYLSDVIGTGTTANPFRPATTAVKPIGYAAEDGRPASNAVAGRMLVRMDVTPTEHAQLAALSGVTSIPFEDVNDNPLSLDVLIGSIPVGKRSAIRTALEAAGVDTDDLTLSDPIRLVWQRMKRRFRLRNAVLKVLDFTEGLDTLVGDIAPARRSSIDTRLQQAGFDTSVLQLSDTIRVALRKLCAQINVGD